MITIRSSVLLRRVLLLDALSCAALGVLLALDAAVLAQVLALPADLLRSSGWVLLPIAVCLAVLSRREKLPKVLVWAVIALNSLWVVQSCAVLLTDWVAPNAGGYAFVLGQAALTALLAEFEYRGLRSSNPVAAGAERIVTGT
jgi:hypothetical protein